MIFTVTISGLPLVICIDQMIVVMVPSAGQGVLPLAVHHEFMIHVLY